MKGTIEFEVWRANKKNEPILAEHEDALREEAEERILSMIPQGYTGGELVCALPTNSGDVHYKGWWSYNTTV